MWPFLEKNTTLAFSTSCKYNMDTETQVCLSLLKPGFKMETYQCDVVRWSHPDVVSGVIKGRLSK